MVLGCIADGGNPLYRADGDRQPGKTELDYAISLKMVLELREIKVSEITGAIIGSVVPPVTSLMREAIRKVTGQEALVVNVDMNIGLEVLMDNPSSVGTDLIVGAVAGINRYPVPLILIDMGTATTICVVNENKQYIGGMILPGIGVSMNSLTAGLPSFRASALTRQSALSARIRLNVCRAARSMAMRPASTVW